MTHTLLHRRALLTAAGLALPTLALARAFPSVPAPPQAGPFRFKGWRGQEVDAERGFFEVPEDRRIPGSRKIRLGYVRFASTAAYVLTTTYGDRAAARAAADRVRKIHDRVTGTDTVTGKPYAANDPALLIWVHAALVDSGLAAAAAYGTALTPAEQDQYVAEMTVAAELVGVPAVSFADGGAPASVAELNSYLDAVRPSLTTSKSTADTAAYLLNPSDIEPDLADAFQVIAAAAVTLLPGWARAMYGFDDARGAGTVPAPGPVPPGREEVRQVLGVLDAVYLGEPGVLEARQRLTLRMRAAERAQGSQARVR